MTSEIRVKDLGYFRGLLGQRPRQMTSETGDGDIRRLFTVASDLHENFYENTMQAFEVEDSLDDVEALFGKLLPLLAQT